MTGERAPLAFTFGGTKKRPHSSQTNPQTEQDCRAEELIGLGAGERAPSFVLLLRERKKDNGHAAGDAPATSVP